MARMPDPGDVLAAEVERAIRRRHPDGISVGAVAELLGESPPSWSRYRSGKVEPMLERIAAWCEKAQLTVSCGPDKKWSATDAKPSEQKIWDAYRTHPRYHYWLIKHDLNGPDDMEAALSSEIVIHEPDPDDPEDTPITLGLHVLHTLAAFAKEVR